MIWRGIVASFIGWILAKALNGFGLALALAWLLALNGFANGFGLALALNGFANGFGLALALNGFANGFGLALALNGFGSCGLKVVSFGPKFATSFKCIFLDHSAILWPF
jgi:hypothetical protein